VYPVTGIAIRHTILNETPFADHDAAGGIVRRDAMNDHAAGAAGDPERSGRFLSETQFLAVLPLPSTRPAAPPLSRTVLSAITQLDEALIPGPEFEFAVHAIIVRQFLVQLPAVPLDAAVQ
jgi:hypothetical protein